MLLKPGDYLSVCFRNISVLLFAKNLKLKIYSQREGEYTREIMWEKKHFVVGNFVAY